MMKSMMIKLMSSTAAFALMMAVAGSQAPSCWWLHQAKAPEALKDFTR